ncbi:LOW QUALITY PROTEIN: hypothetical protein BCV70DRAFT_224390 [Testicularia cyperi]|uniref:Protein kinase domain-containing protein n=1 Tax=Testicularia cyperi TaxID=1882483 RepID=A0A317XWQ1_9BASI|nr:LOW QUALITY PROTEIN: hypothetical protein BCV70DRAFT_224390 [Testicularia cyperi]
MLRTLGFRRRNAQAASTIKKKPSSTKPVHTTATVSPRTQHRDNHLLSRCFSEHVSVRQLPDLFSWSCPQPTPSVVSPASVLVCHISSPIRCRYTSASGGRSAAVTRSPMASLQSAPTGSDSLDPFLASYVLSSPSRSFRVIPPASSPKLAHRTLSPMARHSPISAADIHSGAHRDREHGHDRERGHATISSMLNSAPSYTRPGSASRRDSSTSAASPSMAAASTTPSNGLTTLPGHVLPNPRRGSGVLSPASPTTATRIGIYRPPHLRNRGSISGLKPSVAHYDRVRTPSLRGQSRSRESSISLSRPGSRPPSTIPFLPSDAIPEDRKTDEGGAGILRGRPSAASIHLPNLIAEQQQRNASVASAEASISDADAAASAGFRVPNTTTLLEQPVDSAALLAKLRAQLVRREAAASDAAMSDSDRRSALVDDYDFDENDSFDMSDMLEYGASDAYRLSRHSSTYAGAERSLGDVFEIGDLLGPGMEHDGHIVKIAETTPGFDEQNADLTGSKLEVIRKLGEGSYAVVYLVKEVDADTVTVTPAEKVLESLPSLEQQQHQQRYGRVAEDVFREHNGLAQDADTTLGSGPSEDLLSSTLKANAGKEGVFHNSPALEERRRKDLQINTRLQPGKEFALKCLCKRDLPEDMLEVQRLEATIHQAIPAHPNIVTLYRTYETPDWLFLVLEYCPGQDLYYWLEQAQDSGEPSQMQRDGMENLDNGTDSNPSTSSNKSPRFVHDDFSPGNTDRDDLDAHFGTSLDATPPSPSLLASTSGNKLLSKRRIRLVARMFRQICDAVQFCHDRGISHRDIKPENFIVEDRRTLDQMRSASADLSASTLVDSLREGDDMQVIVKMTDFGLATAEDRCDDFDCGSKPYMAFECHNNISATYDPKQADIWSLGVVLLNMLFHRSPFTEPSLDCPSFAAYCQDPIQFLMESFDGLTESVARFLTENVFCSISDEPGNRISAGDFSRWAFGLVEHMGLSGGGPGRVSRGASIYSTMPLIHSRTGSMSTLPSLLSSPRHRARSLTYGASEYDCNPDATYRAALSAARQDSLSPHPALFTPDTLPSPTFSPVPNHAERTNPFENQYLASTAAARGATPTIEEAEETSTVDSVQRRRPSCGVMAAASLAHQGSPVARNRARLETDPNDFLDCTHYEDGSSPQLRAEHSAELDRGVTHPRNENKVAGATAPQVTMNGPSDKDHSDAETHDNKDADGEAEADAEADADADIDITLNGRSEEVDDSQKGDTEKPQSIATSNHSKRRKRGARKGRTLAKQQLKRSQSVENVGDLDSNDPAVRARERERTIRELAMASESLARQMSKMTKPSDGVDEAGTPPQITLSRPTAEAAARYSKQALALEANNAAPAMASPALGGPAESVATVFGPARRTSVTDSSSPVSPSAANWNSAALRRERMNEQRKAASGVTPVWSGSDSDRSRVLSWRERNQSTATFSSFASSTNSVSSQSTSWSTTSSIYSTSSAPAALARKDFSRRNGTRMGGFGLDTISERERERERYSSQQHKKEVDAQYLAGIFGGGDGRSNNDGSRRKKDVAPPSAANVSTLSAPAAAKAYARTDALMSTQERGRPASGANEPQERSSGPILAPSKLSVDAAMQSVPRQAAMAAPLSNGQRNASAGSVGSNGSSSGAAASFVSRFRRPGSSSSGKGNALATHPGDAASLRTSNNTTGNATVEAQDGYSSLGMRRDASTSTSSLNQQQEHNQSYPSKSQQQQQQHGAGSDNLGTAPTSKGSPSISELDPSAASNMKKRGVGKFLLGVRDSIKNF